MTYQVICAWCKKLMREFNAPDEPNGVKTSHGICQECYDRMLEELEQSNKEKEKQK